MIKNGVVNLIFFQLEHHGAVLFAQSHSRLKVSM